MNGLELSREYFFTVAYPSLMLGFPEQYQRLAVGLVGNGSECYGYDDELSRDHDWGVDFFIWTLERDCGIVPALSDWKSSLFAGKPPGFPRKESDYGAHIGVLTCGDFYSSLIGTAECPKTLNDWLRAPEEQFSMAVNGQVFVDGPGLFSQVRKELLCFYPEDIRRKRIAARCMALAQTGQYNHERTAKRRDHVTLQTVISRFTDNVIAVVFLLNRVFRPYYKWAYRALKDLPLLGNEAARLLLLIAESYGMDNKSLKKRGQYITDLCAIITCELRSQGLSDSDDWFLASHGESVQRSIKDEFLRSLPPQFEI